MSPESCGPMHLLVQADVDGELEPPAAAEVAAHLDSCPACAALHARLVGLSARLRETLPHRAPDGLRRAVREAAGGRSGRTGPIGRRWGAAAGGAAGLALAAGLAVAVALPRPDAMPDWIVAAHIRALQPDHLTDVQSSEQHTVKPWFAGRLPFAPPVRDLAAQGFPLVGGRLDYLPGNTAATLVYGRRRHLIDLFVWPTGDDDRRGGTGVREGYNYVSWQTGGMTFWAVSDLNARELADFAALWR